jgi:retron-type reverse transcriptase
MEKLCCKSCLPFEVKQDVRGKLHAYFVDIPGHEALRKIIRHELIMRCESKLNTNQHGFLPNKSCTNQLLKATDSIATAFNASIRSDAVYFDFAKAFDSVNHDIILRKIKERLKIDDIILDFVVNYLKDREQCVVVAGLKKSRASVRSGVPQGSILGPLLFVLFIDDMSEGLSEGTNIALFTDDTKIGRKINSWKDQEILVQYCTNGQLIKKNEISPKNAKFCLLDHQTRRCKIF